MTAATLDWKRWTPMVAPQQRPRRDSSRCRDTLLPIRPSRRHLLVSPLPPLIG